MALARPSVFFWYALRDRLQRKRSRLLSHRFDRRPIAATMVGWRDP